MSMTYCHQAGSEDDLHNMQKKITVWSCTCLTDGRLLVEGEEEQISIWNFFFFLFAHHWIRNSEVKYLFFFFAFVTIVSCDLARAHIWVLLYVSFNAICLKVGKWQMLIIRVDVRDALLCILRARVRIFFFVVFNFKVWKRNKRRRRSRVNNRGGKKKNQNPPRRSVLFEGSCYSLLTVSNHDKEQLD